VDFDWRELDNRIRSRGADRPCAACGSTDWNAATRRVLMITASEQGQAHINIDTGRVEGIECATITCANCGLVRIHALAELGLL
jgi:hypothetical protein